MEISLRGYLDLNLWILLGMGSIMDTEMWIDVNNQHYLLQPSPSLSLTRVLHDEKSLIMLRIFRVQSLIQFWDIIYCNITLTEQCQSLFQSMCCVAAHVDFGTHFLKSYLKIRTREHFLCFNVWTVESAEYCVFGKCPLLSPCSLPAFAPFKKLLCSEQLSYFYKYYSFHNLLISRADTICS